MIWFVFGEQQVIFRCNINLVFIISRLINDSQGCCVVLRFLLRTFSLSLRVSEYVVYHITIDRLILRYFSYPLLLLFRKRPNQVSHWIKLIFFLRNYTQYLSLHSMILYLLGIFHDLGVIFINISDLWFFTHYGLVLRPQYVWWKKIFISIVMKSSRIIKRLIIRAESS